MVDTGQEWNSSPRTDHSGHQRLSVPADAAGITSSLGKHGHADESATIDGRVRGRGGCWRKRRCQSSSGSSFKRPTHCRLDREKPCRHDGGDGAWVGQAPGLPDDHRLLPACLMLQAPPASRAEMRLNETNSDNNIKRISKSRQTFIASLSI